MDADRLATVAGFAGALVVLAALVWLVGIDEVLSALSSIRVEYLGLLLVIAVVWLFAWGMALRTVLGALGAPVSALTSTLVFAAAVFSNNVTPFGQAGGEPISAYLIARAADREYETGLAAIASVDTLHFAPSLGFATIGFTFVLAGTVELGRNLAFAATAIVALLVGLPAAAYLGWRYRYELEAAVVRALTPPIRAFGRIVPGRRSPTPESVESRIEGFFTAIDRVAGDRRTLVEAMGFSALGWLALCCSLWVSLYALGVTAPFAVVLLVVPMGAIAGFTPLPGGLGGIEAVQVGLLVSAGGVPAGLASAAVLVHRGATYWFPTVIGGGVAFALGANRS